MQVEDDSVQPAESWIACHDADVVHGAAVVRQRHAVGVARVGTLSDPWQARAVSSSGTW